MGPQPKLDPAAVSEAKPKHRVIVIHRDHRNRPVRYFLCDVVRVNHSRRLFVISTGDVAESVHRNFLLCSKTRLFQETGQLKGYNFQYESFIGFSNIGRNVSPNGLFEINGWRSKYSR